MNSINENKLLSFINDLNRMVKNMCFDDLWSDFHSFSYALYNDENVYLVNHNNPPNNYTKIDQNIYKGKWDERFFGNTAITLSEEYIAIWNMNTITKSIKPEKLLSNLIHEMFHAYQLTIEDERYANELLYLTYPFSKENLSLRLEERKWLVNAVFEKKQKEINKSIAKFVSFREKRREKIENHLEYELGMESREGTAYYVEYKSFLKVCNLPKLYLLSKYGSNLAGNNVNLKEFRKSCYSPGLYISVLLDSLYPNWQREYDDSSKFLYDFFLDKINVERKQIEIHEDNYIKKVIDDFKEYKNRKLKKFHDSKGYKIIFKGDFNIAGFDPMNIISFENDLLHNNFFKISFEGKEAFIRGKVLSKHKDNLMRVNEIQFYTEYKPKIESDLLRIQNIGEFKGDIVTEGKKYIIKMK